MRPHICRCQVCGDTWEEPPRRIIDTHQQWCVIPLARLTELVSSVASVEIRTLTAGEVMQPLASFHLAKESLDRLHQLYEAYKRFYYDVCGLMNPVEEQLKKEGIEVPDAPETR